MGITRDPGFPAEAAQLMAAFNRCAGGHNTLVVVEAAANMLIAAIGGHTRACGGGFDDAMQLARNLGSQLPAFVEQQWERQRKPTDIDVPMQGNA